MPKSHLLTALPAPPASVTDTISFFRAWLADPLQVAAIVPSGPALARLITTEITPASAPVIELGPGTGVFTRALLARGVPPERLTLVEFSPDFAVRLAERFPGVQVLAMDAARLGRASSTEPGLREPAGAVVSGLPLLSMPPRKIFAILDGAFQAMRPDGAFYQFTYAPRCPVPRAVLERLGLKATRIGRIFANVPPAAVYRISRRPAFAATAAAAE